MSIDKFLQENGIKSGEIIVSFCSQKEDPVINIVENGEKGELFGFIGNVNVYLLK